MKDPKEIQSALEEFQRLPLQSLDILFPKDANDLKTLMESYGSNIERLHIIGFEINILMRLLAFTPNINHLELHAFDSPSNSSSDSKINLPQLKSLKLINAVEFIKNINCHEMKEISIFESHPQTDWSFFKEFSLQRSFLTNVSLASNIRLTKFELVDSDTFPQQDMQEFLLTHKETLKVLKIWGLWGHRKYVGIIEFVAFELKVEEFHTSVERQGMIEEQKVNRSIKLLELRNFHCTISVSTLGVFASMIPNLKSLILDCYKGLENDAGNLLTGVRFEKVEYFETAILPSMDIFQLFPNVKRLKIKKSNIPASALKHILESQIHLEEISAESFNFDDETVDLILRKDSNIRRITTSRDSSQTFPAKLKQSRIIFSKFHTADVPEYWQTTQY